MKTNSASWYIHETEIRQRKAIEECLSAIHAQFLALRCAAAEGAADVTPLLGRRRDAKRLRARAARHRGAVLGALGTLAEDPVTNYAPRARNGDESRRRVEATSRSR